MGLTINTCRSKTDATKIIIELEGSGTVAGVIELKEALVVALADCTTLLLDVGELTSADPALLQLIHSARSTAQGKGKNFVLTGEFSDIFHKAAEASGILS